MAQLLVRDLMTEKVFSVQPRDDLQLKAHDVLDIAIGEIVAVERAQHDLAGCFQRKRSANREDSVENP